MVGTTETKALEREAYRASYSDGIVDLYVGLSGIWIGIAWIWLPDIAGLAGVLPAIFLAPVLAARKRFIEPRVGYVQWGASRRRWEQRGLVAALLAGLALFIGGIAMFVLVEGGADINVGPGILAWLLALLMAAVAFAMWPAWRAVLYASVLAVGGALAIAFDANPGWPILIGGIVATVTGLLMLRRFVDRYPVIAQPS